MILLFVPALFLLLYGYALNFDIRNVRLAVEDRDRSAKSRDAGIGVRQLRLFRSGSRRHSDPRARADHRSQRGARRARHPASYGGDVTDAAAGPCAGHHRRRQLEHRHDGDRVRAVNRRRRVVGSTEGDVGSPRCSIRSRVWYALSCAARSFSCQASSPTSR